MLYFFGYLFCLGLGSAFIVVCVRGLGFSWDVIVEVKGVYGGDYFLKSVSIFEILILNLSMV